MRGKYTLDDFFRVQTEVSLPGKIVTVRTLSDAEIHSRHRLALKATADRRKELEDKNSEAYQILIAPLWNAPREELVTVILAAERMKVERNVVDNIDLPVVIVPDGATPEEEAEALSERQEALAKYNETIEKSFKAALKPIEESLAKLEDDDLIYKAKDAFVEVEAMAAYNHMADMATLYYACRINGKQIFSSPSLVDEMNTQITQKLYTAYREVAGIDIWDLENFFGTDTSGGPS